MERSELFDRYSAVLSRMDDACRASGRPRGSVRLVAVSKFHPADAIRAAASFGQRDFGENYVQEASAKMAELADLRLSWHAIGHIQSNKAKDCAGKFALLHTLSTRSLLAALTKRMPEGSRQDVLIEVNMGAEEQKSGISPSELPAFAADVAAEPKLSLRGLMCIPPAAGPDEARPWFAALRELRDSLGKKLGIPLPELSMGMSADFPAAIAEGATIIRVGTDIFGPRPARPF